MRTEAGLNSFLSVLDHYYQAGALSEESYLEVKGEAFKKLAHLKKQNAFGNQNRQAQAQPQQQTQKQSPANPHNKKLYDAAEKAMEAAVRAAGTKLLGIKHDNAMQDEAVQQGAQNAGRQPQFNYNGQPQASGGDGLDGASIPQLTKAKNDAKALLEFVEESFREGALSKESYLAARSQKLRDISQIEARLAATYGDDAYSQEADEAEENEEADESEGEEDGLDVFGKKGASSQKQQKQAKRKNGEAAGGFDAIASAEKSFGAAEAPAFEDETDAAEETQEHETPVEPAEGGESEIPSGFPSFAELLQRHAAGRLAAPNNDYENFPQLREPEPATPLQTQASSMEQELLQALGMKKNRHALAELEAGAGSDAGNAPKTGMPKTYSAKAKAKAGGPDDLAGSFTPESIAADEKKEQEAIKASQKPDAAGAFFSKIKSFIPSAPAGAAGQAPAQDEPQTMAVRGGPEGSSEDSAIPTESSAGTMKILMEIEKLKVKTDTLSEMRSALDERLGHIQENMGEMRSMLFQRESSQKELEGKVEKYLDLVEALEPQKFLREFDKRDKELAAQQMRLEKLEAMGADVARTANSTKTLLESMGSLKNLANMNREVAEKLSKMDATVNRSQKTSDDIDAAFIELGKKLEEFSVYAGRQEVLVQTVQDISEMMENTNRKFENYTAKEEMEPLFRQLDAMRHSMSELRATVFLKMEGREIPPRAREMIKQKESIELLLQTLEEDFDARQITAQDYELAKRANLQKLSELERELAKQYEQIVAKNQEEDLKASAIASRITIAPQMPGQAESFGAEEGVPDAAVEEETPKAGAKAKSTSAQDEAIIAAMQKQAPAPAQMQGAQKPRKPGMFEALFKAIPAVPIDDKMKQRLEKLASQGNAAPSAEEIITTLSKKEEELPKEEKFRAKRKGKQSPGQAEEGGAAEEENAEAAEGAQAGIQKQNKPAGAKQAQQAAQAQTPQAAPIPQTQQQPRENPLAKQKPIISQQAQPDLQGQPQAATKGTPASPEGKPVFDLKKLLEMRLAIQKTPQPAQPSQARAQKKPQVQEKPDAKIPEKIFAQKRPAVAAKPAATIKTPVKIAAAKTLAKSGAKTAAKGKNASKKR